MKLRVFFLDVRLNSLKLIFELFNSHPQQVDLKSTLRLFNDRSGTYQVSTPFVWEGAFRCYGFMAR